MRFSNIAGHKDLKKKLIESVKSGKISPSRLFSGPEGSGSLALARAYVQYIFCENKKETDSCGKCPSCHKSEKMIHPDIHFSYPFIAGKENKINISEDVIKEWRKALNENPYLSLGTWLDYLEAENKQANINISECHYIIKSLNLRQVESKYKALIMWLPEFLGRTGNSLLKIIEEPPPHTIFLLVTERPEAIIKTILSRVQLIKVNALQRYDIALYLEKYMDIEHKNASDIALIADGNIDYAISIANSTNVSFLDHYIEWMRICYSGKHLGIEKWKEDFSKEGRERHKLFLKYAIIMLRNSLLINNKTNNLIRVTEQEEKFLIKFSEIINYENAKSIADELERSIYHLERNVNPKIMFLDLSLKIHGFLRQKK